MSKQEYVGHVCMLGKQAGHAFSKTTSYQASCSLELIHGDLCGHITPSTGGGNRYILVLIDDFSRYMWTALLKEKSDVLASSRASKTW